MFSQKGNDMIFINLIGPRLKKSWLRKLIFWKKTGSLQDRLMVQVLDDLSPFAREHLVPMKKKGVYH